MMEREEREGEVEGLINIVWLFFNGEGERFGGISNLTKRLTLM